MTEQQVTGEIAADRSIASQHLYAQGGHSFGHSRTFVHVDVSEADRAQIVSFFKRGANPEYIHAELGRLKLWQVYAVIAQHLRG